MMQSNVMQTFCACISLCCVIFVSQGCAKDLSVHLEADDKRQCVVLLHGLGRTSDSMEPMRQAIEKHGYSCVNIDYPSRKKTIDELALLYVPEGISQCENSGAAKIHFVTHSMGGIILRYYLAHQPVEKLGNAVMLSPPNRGSEVADYLHDWPVYRWYHGPAGQQLGTDSNSVPLQLGKVTFPVGVITGNTNAFFDFWLADIIPGADDGKVSVERAKVEGMADFLVLPYSHPFIMEEEEVFMQTLHFLKYGRFSHHSGE